MCTGRVWRDTSRNSRGFYKPRFSTNFDEMLQATGGEKKEQASKSRVAIVVVLVVVVFAFAFGLVARVLLLVLVVVVVATMSDRSGFSRLTFWMENNIFIISFLTICMGLVETSCFRKKSCEIIRLFDGFHMKNVALGVPLGMPKNSKIYMPF